MFNIIRSSGRKLNIDRISSEYKWTKKHVLEWTHLFDFIYDAKLPIHTWLVRGRNTFILIEVRNTNTVSSCLLDTLQSIPMKSNCPFLFTTAN